MKTQLFIENYEIELNEGVQFLLNKEFEHLSNPTDIINDWSKTVSIPFTEKNNKIFGCIYNPSRIIVSDGTETGYTKMGIYFDPTKKLDFRLVYDSFVLMEGYAKMIDIKVTDYTGTYNITLNGQLGKIFQELKKITFDTTTEDADYLIHGEDYVDTYIDRNLVYNNWTSPGQTHINLMKKDNIYYNINDILGWAPNNSFSEGFDYKSYQVSSDTIWQFASILGDSFKADTGIDAGSVIPNGLLPREIGEYRSYMQLPYIYFNKLFQIFQVKAEELTGYKFDLDGTFFTPSNPDWYNLVYMLKSFSLKNGNTYDNDYQIDPGSLFTTNYVGSGTVEQKQWYYTPQLNYDTYHGGFINLQATEEQYPVVRNGAIILPEDSRVTIKTIPFNFSFVNNPYTFDVHQTEWRMMSGIYILVEIGAYDINDNYIENSQKIIAIKSSIAGPTTQTHVDEYVSVGECNVPEGQRYTWTVQLPYNKIFTNKETDSIKLRVRYRFFTPGSGQSLALEFHTDEEPPQDWISERPSPITLSLNTNIDIDVKVEKDILRTDTHFTLNSLWNKDFNLFDEIIRYCKMHRILIYTDDFERKIYFKQQKKYFENYSIEDWTSKVDRSKEMIVKPITFDNKYVLFNYEDNKTKLGNEYKDKYGFDFGEYRLTTDYNFNTDTTELFKGTKPKTSITNTDNVLSFINLSRHKIVYSFSNEIFIYNRDKDNKQVDTFGTFYYHNGLGEFNTESSLGLIYPKISDDSNFQQTNNTYAYTAIQSDYSVLNTYPKLDVVYDNNLCLFNTPKENYTYLNNYAGKSTIYTRYWENYLNERYNIQNKVVTCYLTLTPKDWTDFRFNKFIKIDGILYMVNKIYDYNIETSEPTKVDLITITDITGYTE